jgi:hypothetical protein
LRIRVQLSHVQVRPAWQKHYSLTPTALLHAARSLLVAFIAANKLTHRGGVSCRLATFSENSAIQACLTIATYLLLFYEVMMQQSTWLNRSAGISDGAAACQFSSAVAPQRLCRYASWRGGQPGLRPHQQRPLLRLAPCQVTPIDQAWSPAVDLEVRHSQPSMAAEASQVIGLIPLSSHVHLMTLPDMSCSLCGMSYPSNCSLSAFSHTLDSCTICTGASRRRR